jgi:hypothetical protein
MKKGIMCFVLMLASAVAINTYGQKPAVVTDNDAGWKMIGQTTANFKMQNESIVVLGADEFTAIKLKVKEAPLEIERLQVFYESGEMEEIQVKDNFNTNGETRVINLKHPDRDIQKVAFTYKTRPNARGEKADVQLFGLKTNQPAGADSYRKEKREAEEDLDSAGREIRQDADEADNDIERSAEKVGDNISEGVNDAGAAIKDKKLKNKVGPGNETAYVDDNGKYYYIDNTGKKVYITKLQLKDKPDNR